MLHEWRTYRLKPGAAPAYLALLAERGLPLVTRHLPLMGYWLAESGPLNVIHHLWSYADWAEREACRAALGMEEAWTKDFIPAAFAQVEEQQNHFLRLMQGSENFQDALDRRRHVHASLAAGMPLFASACSAMIMNARPPEAIAIFEPLSGSRQNAFALLPRMVDPMSAMPSAGTRNVILRPLAFSPL